MPLRDLFTMRFELVTRAQVEEFLRDFAANRGAVESATVELKRSNSNGGVVRAICGMANARGGLIFVGVDEDDPTALLGVPKSNQDSIVNQCRAHLDPGYVPDDILAVPTDVPDSVLLVIRVEPQPHLAPMFFKTAAYVRVPGNTMPATRDQVLAMALSPAGSPRPPTGSLATTLLLAHRPPESLDDRDHPTPDLRLRAAGSFMLRPTNRPTFIDDDVRRAARDTLEQSQLLVWAGRTDTVALPRWRTIAGSATRWAAELDVPRRWPPSVVIGLSIAATDVRLTWTIDVGISEPPDEARDADEARRVMSAEDMLRGLIETVDLALVGLGGFLSRLPPMPPVSPTELAIWAIPRSRDLMRALDLDRYGDPQVGERVQAGQRALSALDLEDIPAALTEWMVETLLDAGVQDAANLARDLVRKAVEADITRHWF